jgi:hypothetical protein
MKVKGTEGYPFHAFLNTTSFYEVNRMDGRKHQNVDEQPKRINK